MASSNRHWPSMFKSKPCTTNSSHHQWQHDTLNSSSTPCLRTPYATVGGCEERTPEPKPRWNPRPEQIRILESIFNSGMVNPPRDEIRKIRAQLQEYGQVGDANVFYWFQNRKSRSKHKQRQQLQNKNSQQPNSNNNNNSPVPLITAQSNSSSSNSSSSNKSSSSPPTNNNSADHQKAKAVFSSTTVIDLLNSPTASVNKPFFQTQSHHDQPFFFPQGGSNLGQQGFCFPHEVVVNHQTVGGDCPNNFLFNELMLINNSTSVVSKKAADDDEKIINYAATHQIVHQSLPVPTNLPSPNYIFQGVAESGPVKSTVFINDVCFEVGIGPFNVKEAFGDDAVLIQSSGHPVITNEWGVTIQPLQHGAFYYLMRAAAFAPTSDDRTIELM